MLNKLVANREIYYQNILLRYYKAKPLRVRHGLTDVTTPQFHGELKQWRKWDDVVGQLYKYNHVAPRPELRAYFFGDYKYECKVFATTVLANANIKPFDISDYGDYLIIEDILAGKAHYVGLDKIET